MPDEYALGQSVFIYEFNNIWRNKTRLYISIIKNRMTKQYSISILLVETTGSSEVEKEKIIASSNVETQDSSAGIL